MNIITGFLTGVPLVEQVIITLPEHLSKSLNFSGFAQFLFFVCSILSTFFLSPFSLAITLYVFRFTAPADYPFGILDLRLRPITPLVS